MKDRDRTRLVVALCLAVLACLFVVDACMASPITAKEHVEFRAMRNQPVQVVNVAGNLLDDIALGARRASKEVTRTKSVKRESELLKERTRIFGKPKQAPKENEQALRIRRSRGGCSGGRCG